MITLKFDFQSIEKGDNQEEKTGKITKKVPHHRRCRIQLIYKQLTFCRLYHFFSMRHLGFKRFGK